MSKRKNDLINEELSVPLEHMVDGQLLPLQCKELSVPFDFETVYRHLDGDETKELNDYREGLLAVAKFIFSIPPQHKRRCQQQVIIKLVVVMYLMLGNQFFSSAPNNQSYKGYQLNISIIRRMLRQEFCITTTRQNILKYINQLTKKK